MFPRLLLASLLTFTIRNPKGLSVSMIGQTISHYRILDKLGEGGMGVVYVAEDTHLGRRVAIKIPTAAPEDHHFHARFLHEARAISMLSHPHIATLHDYGETPDGRPFFVMELVTGADLGEMLRAGTLTLTRAVKIIEDVSEALAEAHHHGIVHRDIKPSNVMINDRGAVKVLDFGLAKQLEDEPLTNYSAHDAETLHTPHTLSGAVMGTLIYLSPEQAKAAHVDARSDIFTLGALLYECIAGRPPFSGVNAMDICAKVMYFDPPPPSQSNPRVPAALDRITLKALAKKPEERYQSARDLKNDLTAVRLGVLRDQSGDDHLVPRLNQAPATSHATPAQPTHRVSSLTTFSNTLSRPRFSTVFLCGLVVTTLLGAWLVTRFRRPAPHQPTPEAARWYAKGESALRDGTYYTASKALESAIHADARFALAHARLAEAWMELDYDDRAKDSLLRAKSLVPDAARLPPLQGLYMQAITDILTRNFAGAINSYRQLVEQVPEAEKAYAYLDLGRVYERNEEVDKAIESYAEAARREPQSAAAFLRLGILFARKGDASNALKELARAEKLYRDSSNLEGVAEVLYQRGNMLQRMGEVADARAQLAQVLTITRATNNQYQQIKSLLQLSTVSSVAGDTAHAQQLAAEAIDLARANGIENLATRGLLDLGNAFFVRGEAGEAEKYFKQALEFAQLFKARRSEARALLSLGSLRIQQDSPDEGLSYVEKALPFYQQGNYRKEISQALGLIGQAHRRKGSFDAARQAFEQQLQLAAQANDQSQVARSHIDMGGLTSSQGEFREALRHFDESYAIYRSLGNQLNAAFCLVNRGEMLWKLGRYEEARASFADVHTAAQRPDTGSKELLAVLYLSEAQMLLSERRFTEAKMKSQQALQLAGAQYKNTAITAQYTHGLAQFFSGAPAQGKLLCREAVEQAERVDNPQLIACASLALAETALESGVAPGALAAAQRAQEIFARTGQQESTWRTSLITGMAYQRLQNFPAARTHLARAESLLSSLQQKWDEESFNTYRARPDIQYQRQQLEKSLAPLQ